RTATRWQFALVSAVSHVFFLMPPLPPTPTLFPYTTLFRSALHPRDDEREPSHLSFREPGARRRPRRDRRSGVDHPLRQQGLSFRAREAAQPSGAADARLRQRPAQRDHRRARSAVPAEAGGPRGLPRRLPADA